MALADHPSVPPSARAPLWQAFLPRRTLGWQPAVALACLGVITGAVVVLSAEMVSYQAFSTVTDLAKGNIAQPSTAPTAWWLSPLWLAWVGLVIATVGLDALFFGADSPLRAWWRTQGSLAGLLWCMVPAFMAGSMMAYSPWDLDRSPHMDAVYATARLPIFPTDPDGERWFTPEGSFRQAWHQDWCTDARTRLGLFDSIATKAAPGILPGWTVQRQGGDLRRRAWTMGCLSDREFVDGSHASYRAAQTHKSVPERLAHQLRWMLWLPLDSARTTDPLSSTHTPMSPRQVCLAAYGYELLDHPRIQAGSASSFARCATEFSDAGLFQASDIPRVRALWQAEFGLDYTLTRSEEGFIGHPHTATPLSWDSRKDEKAP